ncbi:MAG: flavin-containing monooxygenase [Vulcanimicrobiaceae bacterium]
MQTNQIVIVGGGPAGLSTAGALKKVGLTPVVFDRDDTTGSSWLRRYDRLHLHTIRKFSALAHFPIPPSYPKYLSRDMYAEYLQSYREILGIEVVYNCSVDAVHLAEAAEGGEPRFLLRTSQGACLTQTVVIATGMYGEAAIPDFAGFDEYLGLAIHSSVYKSGRMYAAKRVLVVGMGNTGTEIATDLVEQGAGFVAVSIRTSPPVVPRDFLGVPVQLFGISLSRVPAVLADGIGRALARIALGDLTRYGLPAAQWSPFSARRIPVIDVGFVNNVKRKNISIRPTIASFSTTGVTYADGRSENFDAIIFATGYRTGLDTLIKVPGMLNDAGFPWSGAGEKTTVPGLYFMGFIESHRGLLFEIEIASRRLARIIARDLSSPTACDAPSLLPSRT